MDARHGAIDGRQKRLDALLPRLESELHSLQRRYVSVVSGSSDPNLMADVTAWVERLGKVVEAHIGDQRARSFMQYRQDAHFAGACTIEGGLALRLEPFDRFFRELQDDLEILGIDGTARRGVQFDGHNPNSYAPRPHEHAPRKPTVSIEHQEVSDGGVGVVVNVGSHGPHTSDLASHLLLDDLRELRRFLREAMTEARALRPPFHMRTTFGMRPDKSFDEFVRNINVDDGELRRLLGSFSGECQRWSATIFASAARHVTDPLFRDVDGEAMASELHTGEHAALLARLEWLYESICARIDTLLK